MRYSMLLEHWDISDAVKTIPQCEKALSQRLSDLTSNAGKLPNSQIAGNNLKALRLLSGKSMEEFSTLCCIPLSLLKRMESGHVDDQAAWTTIEAALGFKKIGNPSMELFALKLLMGKASLSKPLIDGYLDMCFLAISILDKRASGGTENKTCCSLLSLGKEAPNYLSPFQLDWDMDAIRIRKHVTRLCLFQEHPFVWKAGQNLAFLRIYKQITVDVLAKETGVSISAIQSLEDGKARVTLRQLSVLCGYLGVHEMAAMFYNGYALTKICRERKLIEKCRTVFDTVLNNIGQRENLINFLS